jgi:hypothetical protein
VFIAKIERVRFMPTTSVDAGEGMAFGEVDVYDGLVSPIEGTVRAVESNFIHLL